MKALFFTLLFGHIGLQTFAQHEGDRILGIWLNDQKNAEIEIYKQGEKYYGKVVNIIKNEKKGGDKSAQAEKEEKLRQALGKTILKELVYKKNEWIKGFLIAPKGNEELSCKVSMDTDGDTLEFSVSRGWFSKTIYWTRMEN
jgi:uncharacterized protein (DUF2147 family)